MNNEENPVVHTFNSDIQEELNRKDASLLSIATSNPNHVEPTEPPNYKALFTVLFVFVFLGAAGYGINLYMNNKYNKSPTNLNVITNQTDTNNSANSATSTNIKNTETFQTLMPRTYVGLGPYMSLYSHDNKYIVYKVSNYNGLINVLISNETDMKTDMKNYFGKSENFEAFIDMSYNNWDMRLASSTSSSTLIYAVANKEFVIFATTLKDWEKAYSDTIK